MKATPSPSSKHSPNLPDLPDHGPWTSSQDNVSSTSPLSHTGHLSQNHFVNNSTYGQQLDIPLALHETGLANVQQSQSFPIDQFYGMQNTMAHESQYHGAVSDGMPTHSVHIHTQMPGHYTDQNAFSQSPAIYTDSAGMPSASYLDGHQIGPADPPPPTSASDIDTQQDICTEKLFGTAQAQATLCTRQDETLVLFVFGVSAILP